MNHLVVLCGGESCEHEVSLLSAINIRNYIDSKKYNVTLIAVDKEGNWVTGDDLILDSNNPKKIRINPVHKRATIRNGKIGRKKIDCVFPIIHGTGGEDGLIQGHLSSLNLPFVGSDVLSSAICMDKDISKCILKQKGFSVADHISVPYYIEWPHYNEVVDLLGEGFFVKPASLGSSVGISQCNCSKDYQEAMEDAFRYGDKVILEKCIHGREIEIAVMGNEMIRASSVAGEIVVKKGYYSYEDKYLNKKNVELVAPAKLDEQTMYKFQVLACEAYRILNCEGLARIDFFLTKDGKIYLNEINTLPGFTNISMFPLLWKLSGLSYPALIDSLVNLAIGRYLYRQQRKKTVPEQT